MDINVLNTDPTNKCYIDITDGYIVPLQGEEQGKCIHYRYEFLSTCNEVRTLYADWLNIQNRELPVTNSPSS